MHKRKLVTPRVVGMAMLLMGVSALGILASDGASSAGDATTPPAASATKPSANANEQITALKQQMALQQKQIEQMQKALEEQKRLLEQLTKPASTTEQAAQPAQPVAGTQQAAQPHASSLGEVASTSPMIPKSQKKVENAIVLPASGPTTIAANSNAAGDTETSPLQLHIGSATLTPVGFMDFTSVFRSKTAGGNIGTSFGSIPYATVTSGTTPYQTNLSEFRLSMQNSRIGFRADADVAGMHVLGYMEADFLGTPASTNIAVTSNSNLLRSRLYFVDLRRGSWEILGGQTWSLLTPGRAGISPIPPRRLLFARYRCELPGGLVLGTHSGIAVRLPPLKASGLRPGNRQSGSVCGRLVRRRLHHASVRPCHTLCRRIGLWRKLGRYRYSQRCTRYHCETGSRSRQASSL